MSEFIIKELKTDGIEQELVQIGYDKAHRFVASDKFKYKNIKIYDLSVAQANILKQTAISVGADCATNRDVITGKIELSDAVLGGSISQINKICDKLKNQPFRLKCLGEQIQQFLKNNSEINTKLCGILNVTPDSFSDGGLYLDEKSASKHLIQMINDGADLIDIGAESTRPYSQPVSDKEQIKRLSPILNFIQKENIKTPISIDTRSSVVADFALNSGANIINDVSGFDYDKNMRKVISKYSSGVIIQHSNGNPEVMQNSPQYNNLVDDIYFSLKNKIELALDAGISNIIADPGIGFGKTKNDNFEILERILEFRSLNVPLMIGVSRKSLLGVKTDDNTLKDALSLAISYPLVNKVEYLRVHNVKAHRALIDLSLID